MEISSDKSRITLNPRSHGGFEVEVDSHQVQNGDSRDDEGLSDPDRLTRNLVLSSARGAPDHFCIVNVKLESVAPHPLGDVAA